MSRHLCLLLAALLLAAGCDGLANLDVENENAPNREQAIQSPGDVKSLLSGGYGSWWDGVYENNFTTYAPAIHLEGWGDSQTMTNAFAGLWMPSKEPKVRFQNTSAYANLGIVETPWQNLNAAVSTATDVIRLIEDDGFEITIDGQDQTQMVLASAYFLRGISYGYLANIFNQAYILTPETDITNPEFSPFPEVLDTGIADLERTIEISNANSFTVDDWLPWSSSSVNSDTFARYANSMAARFIVSNSRTREQNTASNPGVSSYSWSQVLQFAQNGIQEDLFLQMNNSPWYNGAAYLSTAIAWYYRVDHRILNLMDPSYPVKYPAEKAGTPIAKAESPDQRLCEVTTTGSGGAGYDEAREDCNFIYNTNMSFFTVTRGPSLQSAYWWKSPWALAQGGRPTPFYQGPQALMLAAENNLIEAEAMIRANGNVSGARSILNAPSSSRIASGGLDPLPSSAGREEVLKAIFYERDIELYRTGTGLSWFDLRRRGATQKGTPLHLPVPATELQTVQEPLYTFGGVGFAGEEGPNGFVSTSTGENVWCKPVESNGETITGNVAPNGCDGPFRVPEGESSSAAATASPTSSGASSLLSGSPSEARRQ